MLKNTATGFSADGITFEASFNRYITDEEIEEAETEIFDLAFDFQMDYDIDISVVIQNKERFNYWLGALPFYNNVQKEGIVLNG